MDFPRCTTIISQSLRDSLFELGKAWAIDPARPRISANTSAAWLKLIRNWIEEKDLPLFVRKHRNNRGARLVGMAGRTLVPTDNSPAQWAFACAYSGYCPAVGEVISLLEQGTLPIAMILKKDEQECAVYRGVRRNCLGTSANGWKLAHIDGVALEHRGSIETCPSPLIEAHFTRFMAPSNMLVVPAEWGGLAEVRAFVDGYCSASAERQAATSAAV